MGPLLRSIIGLIAASVMITAADASEVEGGGVRIGFESEVIGGSGAQRTWIVTTPGWSAELSPRAKHTGERGALMAVQDGSKAAFGILLRNVDVAPYAGKRIAFRSMVRVTGEGQAQPWLRVDRPNNMMGAFDNMHDRPILPGTWTSATIEADVHADATGIVLGFMGFGSAEVSVDDVVIEVLGDIAGVQPPSPARALTADGLDNVRAAAKLVSYLRFFHPTDELRSIQEWGWVAIHLIDAAEPASDADDLATRLRSALAELAPGVDVWATTPGSAAPPARTVPAGATEVVAWRHTGIGLNAKDKNSAYRSQIDRFTLQSKANDPDAVVEVDLGRGVRARIPLLVYADADGTLPRGSLPAQFAPGQTAVTLSGENRSTRLASVALAWGVFQHFYPYFDVVKTDWDAALTDALTRAASDADSVAFLSTLRRLVAALHDGHGFVYSKERPQNPRLPLKLDWAGDDLVVLGTCGDATGAVAVGDTILSIDGASVAERMTNARKQISAATEGWLRHRAAEFLVSEFPDSDEVVVRLRKPDASEYEAKLLSTTPCTAVDGTPARPQNGAEVAPGIRYFDLNGTSSPALTAVLDQLVGAQGVIFDLRGYPDDAAYELLGHLIDQPSQSARWIVPVVTRPDRENLAWQDLTRWQLVPVAPKLPKNIAFLTDGRAISYAESIMGIVEAYKLGAIVGATTAGTNGNVNPFEVPGGFSITWTGMRVLKHDGSQHHGIGVAPTLPVHPTAKGIAEGRDEVLEAAIALLSKPAAAK